MAYTFNDMSFLNAAQKTTAQMLATFADQIQGANLPPGVVPPLSWSQTKRANDILNDLGDLWAPVRKTVRASVAYYEAQAVKDANAANP